MREQFKSNGLTVFFLILVVALTSFSIFSISMFSNIETNKIEYVIKLDQSVLNDAERIIVLNPKLVEDKIIKVLNESTMTFILENSKQSMERITLTISVTAIFFTVIVVVVSLFQFMKNKDYEKQYEQHRSKVELLENRILDLTDTRIPNLIKEIDIIKSDANLDIEKKSLEIDNKIKDLEVKINETSKHLLANLQYSEASRYYRDEKFDLAYEYFESALTITNGKKDDIRLNSESFEAACYENMALCKNSTNNEEEAIKLHQEALKRRPEDELIYYNMANSYHALSYLKAFENDDDRAFDFALKSLEMMENAIRLSPGNYSNLCHYGSALTRLSELTIDNEFENWHNKAVSAFKKAIAIDSTQYMAYEYLGKCYLARMTKKLNGEKEEACKKGIEAYENAISTKKIGNTFDFGSLSILYCRLAQFKNGTERDELLDKANRYIDKQLKQANLYYNVACSYALMNKKAAALNYLSLSLSNKEVPIKHITSDDDWTDLKEDKDFQAIIQKYTVV